VGIGTTTPGGTLRIVNPSNSLNNFGLEPYAKYATVNSDINFSAAVRGESLATSGGTCDWDNPQLK
jgi:hypothetical protein